MNFRKVLWNITKWIFKLLFRIFLILLWGSLRLIEVILQHVNNYLKKVINQPLN